MLQRPAKPEKGKTKATRTRRKDQPWKKDERETSRLYQTIDGPTKNTTLAKVSTSTGRLGHLTALQIDSASKNYLIEVKRRSLPVWIIKAWVQIQQLAKDYSVHPVLVLCMSDRQGSMEYNGKSIPCEDLHCITATRMAELLEYERQVKND